jgi:ribosomal protein S18 acetylase RimI-like enzyme
MPNEIVIVTYADALAHHFERLNRAWIERYFRVEPTDEALFRNPRGAILEPGGEIFFAKSGDEIAGTCAAQFLGGTEWELAKLGVDERFHGRGIGRRLCEEVIHYCRQRRGTRLIIESNRVLAPAIQLYESLGFREFVPAVASPFARANIFLELAL